MKPVISTIYSITVTSPLSCVGIDTVEVVVINPPKPAANYTYTVMTSGLEVQFNNQSVDATTYLWDFADGTTDTVPNPLHDFPNDGTYSVTLYAKNECKGDTVVSSISVIGIEEIIAQERIKIYPNPSDGKLYIDISKIGEKIDEIQVLNSYGQLVFCEKFSPDISGTLMSIDLSGLSKGIYTLLIKKSKFIINSKFVLK